MTNEIQEQAPKVYGDPKIKTMHGLHIGDKVNFSIPGADEGVIVGFTKYRIYVGVRHNLGVYVHKCKGVFIFSFKINELKGYEHIRPIDEPDDKPVIKIATPESAAVDDSNSMRVKHHPVFGVGETAAAILNNG